MLLHHFLEESAHKFPEKVALIHRTERWTYQDIDQRANQVANLLRAQGIRRGDRVAIFLDNSIESVVSLFGILKADAVFLMLSPMLKPSKLTYILNNCGAKALITHTDKSNITSGTFGSVSSLEFVLFVGNKDKIPKSLPAHLSWNEMDSLNPHSAIPNPQSSTESSVLVTPNLEQQHGSTLVLDTRHSTLDTPTSISTSPPSSIPLDQREIPRVSCSPISI